MNKILYSSFFFTTISSSCNKNASIKNKFLPIEVSVKVVDTLFANLILEIQNDARTHLGDENFEYNGVFYDGAILIKDAQCLSEEVLKNVYDGSVINKSRAFKVRINYTAPFAACYKPTGAAKISKSPLKIFYIP